MANVTATLTPPPPGNADDLKRDVGRAIATARKRKGLTQESFAELLGVSATYVARVEGGHENLTLESLFRFSDTLQVPVAEMFNADAAARGVAP